MKKLICIALAALLLVGLTACGEKAAPQKAPEGTPGELIDKIYENHKTLQLKVFTMDVDLNDPDAVRYNLGLEAADKLSAAAVSEAMMGQAYSLAVLRVKDAADAAQVAKDVYDKVDMNKWICVGADTKTAAYCGDLVLFFMVGSQFAESATTETILEAFKTVCGGNVTVIG